MITVTIWHNLTSDRARPGHRDAGRLQPGNPMVRVFAYHADPAGRSPDTIAEEAFAICNGHPSDAGGQDLSRRYYQRELRSLSFPGNRRCCSRSCCLHRSIVWSRSSPRWSAQCGVWRASARHTEVAP